MSWLADVRTAWALTKNGAARAVRRGANIVHRVISFPSTSWTGGGMNSDSQSWLAQHPERYLEANEGWAGIAMDLCADNTAKIPLELYYEKPNGEWEPQEVHPALDLLQRPNDYMDGYELRYLQELSLDIFGNALIWLLKPTPNTPPVEAFLIPWQNVKVERDKSRGITGYTFQSHTRKITFPAEECIHARRPQLGDFLVGRSKLLQVADSVDLARYALKSNVSMFRNGARIGTVIEQEEGVSYSEDAVREFYASFQENHAGVGRSHFPIVVPNGWKVHTTKPGDADIDYTQAHELAKAQILAAWRVPPAILGSVDSPSRAHQEAAMYAFQVNALEPRVRYWLGSGGNSGEKHQPGIIEQQLMSHWDAGRGAWRVSYSPFIERNRAEDRADMTARISSGITSQNEERQKLGFDPIEDPSFDVPKAPSQMPGELATFAATPSKAGTVAKGADRERAVIWRRFARKHRQLEKEAHKVYLTAFHEQRDEVLRRAAKVYPKAFSMFGTWGTAKARKALAARRDITDALFPPAEKEAKRIVEAALPVGKKAVMEAARELYGDLGVEPEFPKKDAGVAEIEDPITEAAIEKWLRDIGIIRITEIDEATMKKLRRVFEQVVSEGGGLDQLQQAIRDVYEEFDRSRAYKIARTEMTGAWNHGQLEAAKSLDVEVRKVWLPALDERTRDAHRTAGETYAEGIPVDQPFIVDGERLMHPGDPNGSAHNVIHCRCSLMVIPVED